MKIKPFNVVPNLPEQIVFLREIATNLWSSWNWQVTELFMRLDHETWEKSRQNLVLTLGRLDQKVLDNAARDDSFIANLSRVWVDLQTYLNAKTYFQQQHEEHQDLSVAYFSMEFGIDVGLPIYSGGLGVLAGDHLKSASDLGIPLVGVGLLYQRGYFQQYLNSDGWQMEKFEVNDWYNMPVTLQKDSQGNPLTISVELGQETLHAHIWRVIVGRISLYLLDTNISMNPPHLRKITQQLYDGDREIRIRQEILLGVGGLRALKALNIEPSVYHMNEGHSAFLVLERARVLIEEHGLTFKEAREIIWSSNVFTTHTPVPAGNEVFDHDRMKRHFTGFVEKLGISWDEFLALGSGPGSNGNFSMTVLALNTSAHCNGVSKLHRDVSRNMWNGLWHNLPQWEIPIRHITNGIHTRTWISHELDDILIRYIGPHFVEEPHNQELWERVNVIPDVELWRVHQIRKERLIFFARERLRRQLKNRGASASAIEQAQEVLSSDALTIGFARRFATYKRANLILHDAGRLMKLLQSARRPIQIIFAGKAHPHDNEGKEYIRKLIHFSTKSSARHRFVFLEDYDINVARYLVQGVDVWLNTPRRPFEASGTSGMKAAANGAINVSTLDGWWEEAYEPGLGWAIGSGESEDTPEIQDKIEAEALYNLLEDEIIPLFFDTDSTGIPRNWIKRMKLSMKNLGQYFNTHRMVMEYLHKFYKSAHDAGKNLTEKDHRKGKDLAMWRKTVFDKWDQVRLLSTDKLQDHEIKTGSGLDVNVEVKLGSLSPSDVAVEAYFGPLDEHDKITYGNLLELGFEKKSGDISHYKTTVPTKTGGRHGYAIRIRPKHPDLIHPWTPFLLKWEE